MNYLITTASSIQLINAEGTTKTISKNLLWYRINKETITFLVLADAEPEGDGTCFFTSKISDLNVNGEVYDKDTIVKALDDIFEPVDIADVYTKRQIDEMLEEYAQVDDLNDFIMVDELPEYLADYQEKLVSGTNIKTVNGQSLLGEGNIVIEGGGGGSSITIDSALSSTSENAVQNKVVKGALDAKADKTEIPDMAGYPTTNQMNTAINSAVAGKADANSVPTKTSQLTNDSGFLTSHQSLDGLFNSVEYNSSAKRINFKDKTNTVVGYVDAAPFVKDGMIEDVKIENGNLVIDFNTDSGTTDISIPLTDIFNADNYYTKSEVDNGFAKKTDIPALSDYYTKTEVNDELAKKADTDNLATVATSGSYNDLSDKPIIPDGAVIDSALSDTSNNAVANRIVKGALDLKADKTEIPDMAGYSTTEQMNTAISTATSGKADKSEIPTKTSQLTNDSGFLTSHQSLSDYYTKTESNQLLANKQDSLVSGTNIKTVNNQSILGSGNITIEAGSQITVDSELSSTSENPVQNKVIYAAIGDIETALKTINGTV